MSKERINKTSNKNNQNKSSKDSTNTVNNTISNKGLKTDSISNNESTNKSVKRTGKVNGRKRKKALTRNMEAFCRNIVTGQTAYEAYLNAYPSSAKASTQSIKVKASSLSNRVPIIDRIEELRVLEQAKLEALAVWETAHSVLALKKVVEINLEDMNRVQKAITDEIEHYESLLNHAIALGDEKEAARLLKQLMTKRKQRAAHITNNMGVTNAVVELNNMHGYYPEKGNEKDITATVIFKGENELPE